MNKREKLMEIIGSGWKIDGKYPEWCSRLADKILALDEGLSEGEIQKIIYEWYKSADEVQIINATEVLVEPLAKALSGRIAKPQPVCSCSPMVKAYPHLANEREYNKDCQIHGEKKPRKIEYLESQVCGIHTIEKINEIIERINEK